MRRARASRWPSAAFFPAVSYAPPPPVLYRAPADASAYADASSLRLHQLFRLLDMVSLSFEREEEAKTLLSPHPRAWDVGPRRRLTIAFG